MSTGKSPELRTRATPQESAQDCSQYILSLLADASSKQERVTFAISGGSTPKLLFADMAKAKFDWTKIHFFWVDERCVPPDDDESNFKLARETLLAPAHIAQANIHRVLGELPPVEGAKRYLDEITGFFQLSPGELPVFDVLHRGMGPDAHTASLFPGSPLVADRTGIATSVWVEKMKNHRVTLLPGVLLAARHSVLQVAGDDKAAPLKDVLEAPEDFLKYPCQIASRDERAVWFLDRAAASKL